MNVGSLQNDTNVGDLGQTIASLRSLRRETVRREILENGRIDLLATHVLGYEAKPFHLEMMRFQSAAKDTCLALAPRGFGKSIILTIVRTVFEIIRNPNIRILIASNTQLQSEIFLREIKFHLEHNVRVLEYFGCFASDDKWDNREIIVGPRTSSAKESTVSCVGVGGAVASRHYDLIIADDLVDEENSRTELQREKVKTWYYKTLGPCLEPDGRIFVIGTRYHYLDLYGHLIKNELADKHQIIPAIDTDGKTPWPEKFSLEWLEIRRQQMGSLIFNTQYMNDVSMMRGSIFKEEWFRFYDEQPDWEKVHNFIGCDPAATKREALLSRNKANTDWWTIVVGGRIYKSRKYSSEIYVREVWRARCSKDTYLEKLKEMNNRYKPLKVMIETVAAQEYLAVDAEKFMPVKRVERKIDKVARAYWTQAFFENGQILFPDKSLVRDYSTWQALLDELLLFPQAEHDDLFDGLQTMMEGALSVRSESGEGYACAVGSMRDDVDDYWDMPDRDWDDLYV
jgi:predicted phage terminase large subunit-like protein